MKLADKFIGIPFKSGGRDFNGADCWGIAVLFYREYLAVDLPSYSDCYFTSDTDRLRELIAQYREGWERISKPQTGDLILFKLLGSETHIGVYIGNGKFLHATEKAASVVQNLESPEWNRRVSGYFRYKAESKENLPEALSTKTIYCEVQDGTTAADFLKQAAAEAKVDYDTFASKVTVLINGAVVPKDCLETTTLKNDDVVEYRVVAQKDVLRVVLIVAIVVIGQQWLAGTGMFAGGGLGLTGASLTGATIGLQFAATLLVNAIFPIRPPAAPQDPGQAKQQYLLNGGQNRLSKYEPIPVVLGKVRLTPPHAANPYAYDKTELSYLRMLLCWGYGPLEIEDVCIGGTSIDQYIASYTTYSQPWHDSATRKAALDKYGSGDVEQNRPNLLLAVGPNAAWYEYTFSQEVDTIDVTLNFPNGLRKLRTKGGDAGSVYETLFTGEVQYRLAGSSTWTASNTVYLNSEWKYSFTAPMYKQYISGKRWDDGGSYVDVFLYQWHTVCLDPSGTIKVISGTPSQSPTQPANASTLALLASNKYSNPSGTQPLKPDVPNGSAPLFRICVQQRRVEPQNDYGSSFIATRRVDFENLRNTSTWTYQGLLESWVSSHIPSLVNLHTALNLAERSTSVTISTGAASPGAAQLQFIQLGDSILRPTVRDGSVAFSEKKDPFSFTHTISLPGRARYEVRVRRTNGYNDAQLQEQEDAGYQILDQAYLTAVTGTKWSTPVIEPKNCQLALTGIELQATDQLNGSIEGINALVTSIALDYNQYTQTWILGPTQNPASLFRYVLEHPANAQRVRGNISEQVHLAEIEEWHTYCKLNNFEYNDVVTGDKSLLDVLRDIAAAGRASPLLRDGKWTVVIDRPRQSATQYFTPHNSWGFESTRALPQQPDAFRVVFPNEDQNYQESEIICYNSGKNESNSELYEELRLPGITNELQAARHARWHLAQLKLRPEVYTLNTDMEYLVCTRGDLVRVAHDVPMWGTGTGRIQGYISSTVLALSEEFYLEQGKTYVLRIRLANGQSITRNIAAVPQSSYYSTVTLQTAVTATEGAVGNLYMLGELEKETQELIVISIEPSANYTARLTLVDYSPDLYTIEEVDNTTGLFNEYPIPSFDTGITKTAKNLVNSITVAPIIQDIKSDETALEVLSPGVFRINMVASFKSLENLPDNLKYFEVQAKLSSLPDVSESYSYRELVELPKLYAKFTDLQEGVAYTIRARYVGTDGRTGPWSALISHTVIGKTSKPSDIVAVSTVVQAREALVELSWNSSPDLDLQFYEIRTVDLNWGQPGYTWRGTTTKVSLPLNAAGTETRYYIKAADYSGNYSVQAGTFVTTVQAPSAPTSLQSRYSTTQGVITSTTNSTVTLTWSAGPTRAGQLAFKHFKLVFKRTESDIAPETVFIAGTSYTTRADWLGTATLTITAVDTDDNESIPAQLSVVKLAPPPVTGVLAEVVDNNVFLRWNLPAPSSLPISHVLLKRGSSWSNPESVIGEKSGTFTSIIELVGGQYTYMIAAVDTDGRESEVVSVPATVSQPPDFIFNAEYRSNFTGPNTVLQNSIVETNTGRLLMLVNTTETWATHFTSRSWTSPSSQISAGYPIYAQPGLSPASYREVFDYGTVLASSSITVSVAGSARSGAPVISASIETSTDGVSWSTPVSSYSTFAANFRYVRVTVYATKSAPGDLYLLESVIVRLDSKQKNDSGNSIAMATDTLGTIVNFSDGKEFIDVTSITLTPAGTSPVIAVYDFKDATLQGTYTVSSGVCTVNITDHGLETGQRVRLSFITGIGVSGVYYITKVSNNEYTVQMNTISSTSGSVSTYPQSMRVYLFDNNGVRQTGGFGWAIRGY